MAENAAPVPEKMAYPGRPEPQHGVRQWVLDERDAFISWLRAEFAAANAIIDSLCHHLRTTGEPGEYDMMIACIQQRRYNWNPVLHMQQYFSIAEVVMALQQAAWQRQQRGAQDHQQPKFSPGKDFKRSSMGYRHSGGRFDGPRDGYSPVHASVNAGSDRVPKGEVWGNADRKGRTDSTGKEGGDGANCSKTDCSPKDGEKDLKIEQSNANLANVEETESSDAQVHGLASISKQEQSKESFPVPKSFTCNETCDGKMVNVFEGLKLYEDLLDVSEVTKIVSLANTLKLAGRRGDLQGQTFLAARKPSKGHGKEIIQLGTCIYDGPIEDENAAGSHKEKKVEAIPTLLQDVLDRLIQQQVIITRPDYCVIDFFNEGEHSQPHLWLLRYGRPLFHLVLTDCDMVFGRTVNLENRGEYRGSLRISLKSGSLLVLQGRSADMAKRAINSIRKQRIIVTFGKSQLRDTQLSNSVRQHSTIPSSTLTWGQHSNRPTNLNRRPSGPKSYAMVSGSGVLQAPHIRSQQPSTPNGIQPLFVAQNPVPINAGPYSPVSPVSTSAGWTVAPRKADVPRLPVPGTGVFLPPTGSVHPPPSGVTESSSPAIGSPAEKMQCAFPDNEQTGKQNCSSEVSPGKSPQESSTAQLCNGDTNSCSEAPKAEQEDHSLDSKLQTSNKQAAPAAIAAMQ